MRISHAFRGPLRIGGMGRALLTLVVGTTISQAIVVASAPFLTRLYTPSELGTFSVAIAILSVLLTVTCLSYQWAIPLPNDEVAGANVLALALAINLGITVLAAVGLWVAGQRILSIFGAAALGGYVLLVTLDQLGAGTGLALTGWALRTKAYGEIAATGVTASVVQVTSQVGLGILGLGAPGLLLGDVAGRYSGSARLAWVTWRTHGPSFRQVTRAGIVLAARRYRRFPMYSTGSALLNTIGSNAPLLLIAGLFGATAGGQFALAYRVAMLPIILVSGSAGQVFFSEAARSARKEPAVLGVLFRRVTLSLAKGGVAPAILIMITAPFLFPLVFGDAWLQAGLFAAILAPMSFLTLVTAPTGSTLYILERQDLHLVREVIRIFLLLTAALTATAMHLPPVGVVVTISVAGCVTYVLYGLISWMAIVAHRRHPRPLADHDADNVLSLADSE
ncbi:MAG: oligosaccharide flippase family protein [Propionibacteriales bacterium]|nr:oligosaccharide flippase family protein [Propionibacteriales bacterium]